MITGASFLSFRLIVVVIVSDPSTPNKSLLHHHNLTLQVQTQFMFCFSFVYHDEIFSFFREPTFTYNKLVYNACHA